MDALFTRLQVVRADLARSITSLRVSQNLFDDLADDPQLQAAAVEIEMQAKPKFYASATPAVDRPFEQAAWLAAVRYPFDHWAASRYSDGRRYGVWYGADTVETTVYETVYHWRRFLEDADMLRDGVVTERKVFHVHCAAALIDLRPHLAGYPDILHPEDYTYCQQIGQRIAREGHPGLLTRSARCAGEVYGVFNPTVLSNPRPLCFLTYCVDGEHVQVEREPGLRWLSV